MKNCQIIINKNAGGSRNVSFEKVEACLGENYIYTRFVLPDDAERLDFSTTDAVAVCGGDGTFSSIMKCVKNLDIEVFYFPSGTLNDKAKAERYSHAKQTCPAETSAGKPIVVGSVNDDVFTYVYAAGSFTPIGYTVDIEKKKKYGVLAYVCAVLKEYKPHRIRASIKCDGRTYEDEYTLIMFLKSPRCFGFRFNRAFDPECESGHLLAIRSPKHDGILGCIEMFFPFFRTFFIGLNAEREGEILFKKMSGLTLCHDGEICFCKDGEKQVCSDEPLKITFERTKCRVSVMEKF